MERSGSVSLPLVLVGLAGVGAFTAVSTRGPSPASAVEAIPVGGARAPSAAEAEADLLVGVRPALELIADHLDVPREEIRLAQDVRLTARVLESGASGDAVRRARQLAALECGNGSEEDPACVALRRPDEKGDLLAALSAADMKGPAETRRQAVVQHLAGVQQAHALLAAVKRRLCTAGPEDTVAGGAPCTRLEVLIATMPDYVDSHSAWLFDRNLDGVQRAAGAAGYVLDRFYLPDWDPNARSAETRGERHASQPGAILYRQGRRLLLVLTPLETATAGVSKRAMLSAVALARELAPPPVRVVGPTFSGSVRSLRIVFDQALRSGLVAPADCPPGERGAASRACFVVRSGSASNASNKRWLEREYCGLAAAGGGRGECIQPVAFSATTVTDTDMQTALSEYLGSIDPAWRTGRRVAILYEATTTFGQGVGQQNRRTEGGDDPRATPVPPPDTGHVTLGSQFAPSRRRASGDEPAKITTPFPEALRLTYPLHVSRLRTEAGAAAAADSGKPTVSIGPAAVALRLDDSSTPTDQLPAVRPQATAAVVQTTLDTIVDTLDRAHVTAVGLYGTDDRDKIYLAEQLRYRAPNVLLFTLEGSLVVLHPQARAFMTGAVVAAVYPYQGVTQLLGARAAGDDILPLQQFQAVGAEGLYNAFLSQLSERLAEEDPARAERLRGRLADYSLAGCGGPVDAVPAAGDPPPCGPGVWISVVGRNAVWPVRRFSLAELWARQESPTKDYAWMPPATEGPFARVASSPPGLLPVAHAAAQGRDAGGAPASGGSTEPATTPRPGSPRWPASAVVTFAIVVAVVVVHLLGLVAIAWILVFERHAEDDGRPATGARGLARRLRRHVPWLEPPDLCAACWAPAANEDEESRHERECRDASLRQEYWLSLLACGGAVLTLVFWTSHLYVVGLVLGGAGAEPLGWLAAGRVAAGLLFLTAAAAALFPTAERRRAGLSRLSALRVLPVSLGFLALWHLNAFLIDPALWRGVAAPFNVLRLAEVKSLVSPTVPLGAFAVAVYLWGLWNLWRIHHLAVPFGARSSLVAVLARLGRERPDPEQAAVRRARLLLDSPALSIGLLAGGILAGLTWLQLWAGATLGTSTADGAAMGRVLFFGTMLVSFLVAHTLAYGGRQAASLLQVLDALSLAPIGPVFEKLGRRRELWQISAGTPRAEEAHLLVQQARTAAYALANAIEHTPAVATPRPESEWKTRRADPAARAEPDERARELALQLHVRPGDVALMRHVPVDAALPLTHEDERRPLHASPAWRGLQEWSEHVVRVLWRGPWSRHSLVPLTSPAGAAAGPRPPALAPGDSIRIVPPANPRDTYFAAAETLLGLQVAYSLRYSVIRLMSVFGLAVSALLLLLCGHLFYSFQSRAFWLGIDWMLIGVATAVAVYFFVRLEKSAVLSYLWQSEPGKVSWGDQLFRRILIYGAIPVITLFMTFFPEVGAFLFSWLEPVQKSLL